VNLSTLLATVKESLERAGVPTPGVEAEIIISHVLGMARGRIYLEPDMPLSPATEASVQALSAERAHRVPLQYLIGRCEFMSLPFKVRRGVFIPRPETEILVETIIDRVSLIGGGRARILDLGTGAGVVGISLAKHLKPQLVLCCDISPVAVEIAAENAILNGVADVMMYAIADALDFVRPKPREAAGGGFDVLACNPPYVASGEIEDLEPEVRDFDPRAALDGGEEGLDFIAGILPRIPSIMRAGGLVGLEIGATQAHAVLGLCSQSGLQSLEVVKDLSGRDRVIVGRVA
jgi:release factor glutamine methyltransferase